MLLTRRVSIPAWAVVVALLLSVASWVGAVVVGSEPRRWGDVAPGLTRERIRELLGVPDADMAEKGWDGWDRTHLRELRAPRTGAEAALAPPTASAAEPPRAAAPAALEQEILQARDPEDRESCFEHATADLDGDGKDEVLVLDRGPAWCGTGGCTVTVYARGARGLAEVASIPLVDRLSLGQGRTNGWRDLVVRNRYGTWLLAFDGKAYPDNPTLPPARKIPPPDPAAGKLAWTKATTCR